MKTHSGPKCSHIKPPTIGAGIEAKPWATPRSPLHLPIQLLGTNSAVIDHEANPEIILNPKKAPANNRKAGKGAKAKSMLAKLNRGVRI